MMHTSTCISVTTLNREIRATLEEADQCYTLMIEAGEHPNIDRLGYASQITLDVFRRLLGRPDLEAEEVAAALREAEIQNHRAAQAAARTGRAPPPLPDFYLDSPDKGWPSIMTGILIHRANQNGR